MTVRGIDALMRPVWAASWHHLSKQLSIATTGHAAVSRSSIDTSSMFCFSHSRVSHFLPCRCKAARHYGFLFSLLKLAFSNLTLLQMKYVTFTAHIILIYFSAPMTACWMIPLNTSGPSFLSSLE